MPLDEYQKIVDTITSSRRFGIELGLSKTKELLKRCGSPDRQYVTYQVAGTNGKGSTTLFLAALLKSEGHKVGVFMSPHLERFTERFVVDEKEATPQEVVEATQRISKEIKEPLTFFEWSVAIALVHFEAKGCDRAVLEVGLGGRLDATTAADRQGVVITGIDYDHQEYLGDTLEEIAKEKAAVAMAGKPAFVGVTGKTEAKATLVSECLRLGASPVECLQEEDVLKTPLHWGKNRRQNAACAYHAARLFGVDIASQDAINILRQVVLPGRLEPVLHGEQTFILDGAHNPGAAKNLKEQVKHVDLVIVGINGDKNAEEMIKTLLPISSTWITTASDSERAMTSGALEKLILKLESTKQVCSSQSVEEAISSSKKYKRVLICGSLYLVGEARSILAKSF